MPAPKIKTPDIQKVLSDCRRNYDAARRINDELSNYWTSRLSALRGEIWKQRRGAVTAATPTDDAEIRLILNRIRGIVRALTNGLVRGAPLPLVRPATSETSDRAKARASERLLHAIFKDRELTLVELEAAHWAMVCGAGFIKIWWNPKIGHRSEVPLFDLERLGSVFGKLPLEDERPESMLDSQLGLARPRGPPVDPIERAREAGQLDEFAMFDDFGDHRMSVTWDGDVDFSFVDSQALLLDPDARRWKDVRWVIHRRPMPKEDLLALHPKTVDGEDTSSLLQLQERTDEPITTAIDRGVAYGADPKRHPELCELWEAPSARFQNGRIIQWSGNAMFLYDSCPYRPARIPFVPIRGEGKVPNTFYADGAVHDLIPAAKAYFYAASKMVEWERLILNPKLLIPEESEVEGSQFSDRLGEHIKYRHPFKPEWMHVPEISASIIRMVEMFREELNGVASVSELTFGAVPAGAESGRAMAVLGERDLAFRFMDHADFAATKRELSRQTLWLAFQFYEEGRLVRRLGANAVAETIAFKREDYSTEFDIDIEPFGPGQSRPQRVAETLEAWERGLFGPREDPNALEEAQRRLDLDFRDRTGIMAKQLDRDRALAEQLMLLDWMKSGVPSFAVNLDYDSRILLEEHALFRKGVEYQARVPPEVKAAFMTYVGELESAIMMQNRAVVDQTGGGGPARAPGLTSFAGPEAGLVGAPPATAGGLPSDAQSASPTEAAAFAEAQSDAAQTIARAQQLMGTSNGAME